MIEKSRLEELIKEGATIYYLEDKSVCLIFLNEDFNIDQVYFGNTFEYWLYFQNNVYKPLNELYETHEQAEWQLEFGNITRTETLSLPTWEDVYSKLKNYKESDAYTVRLVDNDFCSLVYVKYDMVSQIVLYTHYEAYDWNATKENYIEACKLCKKLFLGGESDESLCNKE